jgi:hypothetical protein
MASCGQCQGVWQQGEISQARKMETMRQLLFDNAVPNSKKSHNSFAVDECKNQTIFLSNQHIIQLLKIIKTEFILLIFLSTPEIRI